MKTQLEKTNQTKPRVLSAAFSSASLTDDNLNHKHDKRGFFAGDPTGHVTETLWSNNDIIGLQTPKLSGEHEHIKSKIHIENPLTGRNRAI